MKNRHLEMASRTLTDLPSELLHMLCTQLARCSTDIRRFSCVCRRVRAVALEYLNFRRMCVRSILSFAPLVQFLRAYPRVAETVVSLQLYGAIVYNEKEYSLQPITIIDDTHVASVMEYLPNLVGLVLEYFQFANPPPTHQRECPPGPFRISWISIISNCEGRSSLTGALCVLSLFTLRSLDRLDLGRFFNTKTPFERELLHRPLDIQQLSLSSFFNGPAYLPTTLRAFTESLKDDSLQVLRIRVDTGDAVLAMGELLIHAGSNITTLEIDLSLPATPIGRVKWVNPFRDTWEMLHLSSCTKLEFLCLPIYLSHRKLPVIEPIVGILSQQASPTLRQVMILATGLVRLTTVEDSAAYKLHELDEALSPTRFPHLQRCIIQSCSDWALYPPDNYWPRCVAEVQRSLKSLHARGLLSVWEDSD